MLIRFFYACMVFATLSFWFPCPALHAQNFPPNGPPAGTQTGAVVDTANVAQDDNAPLSGDQKLPLEKDATYADWTHHTAQKAEEALVRVRFTPQGGGPETVATGLVVRCDGFVLVPRGVAEMARAGGALTVTLSDVDGTKAKEGEKAKGAVMAAARIQPRLNRTVPYGLIKTNGYHCRSLPLLNSASVAPGKPVRALWLGSGTDPIQAQNRVIGPAEKSRGTFALSMPEQSSPTLPIPVGAIVVDGESGAALGVVTESAEQTIFTTFAQFYFISSEVGLAPDRAAVRLGDHAGSLPKGTEPMVWVPGGPVALDGQAAQDFLRDYGTTTVCTPGFWMAVQPVTNEQYGNWMRAMNRPLPVGWTDLDRTGSVRRPDRPACGVILEEASLYAAANQARLPTEAEWRRAAYTRPGGTDWVKELIADTAREREEMKRLFISEENNLFFAAAEANTAAYAARGLSPDGMPMGVSSRNQKPQKVLVPVTPELAQAAADIHRIAADYQKNQWEWGQVGPIDAFRQDRSVFGVRNVITNAPEMVQSRLHEFVFAPKPFPATVDPDLTQFTWTGNNVAENTLSFTRGPDGEDLSFVGTVRRGFREISLIHAWRLGPWGQNMKFYDGREPIYLGVDGKLKTYIYAGFRCAR